MKKTKRLMVSMLAMVTCLAVTIPAIAATSQGSQGQEVVKLQEALVADGYNIAVDGEYGPNTEAAVEAFRENYGLDSKGGADDEMMSILYAENVFKEYVEMTRKYEDKEITEAELTKWLEDNNLYDELLLAKAGVESVTSETGNAEVDVKKLSEYITEADLTKIENDDKNHVAFDTLVEKAKAKMGVTVDKYIENIDDMDKLSAAKDAIKAMSSENIDIITVAADLLSPFINKNKIANKDDAIEKELEKNAELKDKVEKLSFVLEAFTSSEETNVQQPAGEKPSEEKSAESKADDKKQDQQTANKPQQSDTKGDTNTAPSKTENTTIPSEENTVTPGKDTTDTTNPSKEDITESPEEETAHPSKDDTIQPSTEDTTEPSGEDVTTAQEDTTQPSKDDTTQPSTDDTTQPSTDGVTDPTEEVTEPSTEADHEHHYEVINQKKYNCTTDGYTGDIACIICGDIQHKGEVIPAQHIKVYEGVQAATCTEDGHKDKIYCQWCGEVFEEGEVIPATGHTIVTENAKEATCAEDGYTGDRICSTCGEVFAEGTVIPATGNHQVTLVNVKVATTTSEGYTGDLVCSVCGTVTEYGAYIPKIEEPKHEHTLKLVKERAATCTVDGYTGDQVCETCGDTVEHGTTIPATGHGETYTQGAKAATCTENGYTGDQVCTTCGEIVSYGTTIPATGHSAVMHVENDAFATCTENGYTGDWICDVCGGVIKSGTEIPATGHQNVITVCDGEISWTNHGYSATCSVCLWETEVYATLDEANNEEMIHELVQHCPKDPFMGYKTKDPNGRGVTDPDFDWDWFFRSQMD